MSYKVPELAPVIHMDDYRSALPPLPPIDATQVWGEVLAAAQLFGTLREAGMSVRFETTEEGMPPRVMVTDLAGRTLREIPAELACDPQALEAELLSAC